MSNPSDKLLDEIAKHTFELERIGNYLDKENRKEFLNLSSELEKIVKDYREAKSKKLNQKQIQNIISNGKRKISKSYEFIEQRVKRTSIDIGKVEDNFTAGVVNKVVTGDSSIHFVSKPVENAAISSIAEKLIIEGAPQGEWWGRQTTTLKNKFSDVVKDSFQRNLTIDEISRRIAGTKKNNYKDGILNIPRYQANALGRTSIASVANKVREETLLINSDVISGVELLVMLDSKTSDICLPRAGSAWEYVAGEWVIVSGSHDYSTPPYHFQCRSTIIPTVRPLSELTKKQADLVLEENKDKLHKPAKQQDVDKWLKTQPEKDQKDILGGLHKLWQKDKVSVRKVLTQNGRVRSPKELEVLAGKKGNLAREPQTSKKLQANDIANQKYAKEVIENTLEDLYKLEQRVILKSASDAERDKLGRLFINTKPSDLEYKKGFKPVDFKDLLGNEDKRLKFYTHTAKRFERTAGFRKGDFSARKTNNLNRVDNAVLNDLIYKIETDSSISRTNKELLIKVSNESPGVIGTQRSVAVLRSLLTQARKKDFSDIKDYIAYNNNALRNSINEHFEVVIRKERRITDNTDRTIRFNTSSEVAKDDVYAKINNPKKLSDSIDLKEVNRVRDRIEKIGSRGLRDFDGQNSLSTNVNLELADNETISLYLSHIYPRGRLGAVSINDWSKRISSSSQHKKRVDYIASRLTPGEPALIDAKLLKSPLFKEWEDGVWSGRGFSQEIKDEIGLVLVDAEIKQNLKGYLSSRVNDPDKAISKYISDPGVIKSKLSIGLAVREVDGLYDLKGRDRVKLRAKRDDNKKALLAKTKKDNKQDADELDAFRVIKDNFFIKGLKKDEVKARKTKAEALREEIEELIGEDKAYSDLISNNLEKLVAKNRATKSSEFFKEANSVIGIPTEKVSKLITQETLNALNKGQTYTSSLESLGNRYYTNFLGVAEPDKIESIRMGHFLIRSVVDSKLVKLKKSQNVYKKGFGTVVEDAYQLEVLDKKWLESALKNKNNYDVEGLPSLASPRIIKGREQIDGVEFKGTYADGTSLIKTRDKEWAANKVVDDQLKPWVKNIDYESKVKFRVNNYVYDVMTELDKRGDALIPKRLAITETDKSLRNRFDVTRQIAKNVRDEDFYNSISADKYGRTYTNNVFLSGQGNDASKGLIRFSDGVELGDSGYDSFARVFANNAGFDKVPMRSRVKLLKKIDEKLILKTVENPIKYDWWRKQTDWIETGVIKNLDGIKDSKDIIKLAKAADPSEEGAFQFLSLLEERARMIGHVKSGKSIKTFSSNLSMPADGTTNVLQHMAAISRDPNLAKVVNMTTTADVQDAYLAVRLGELDNIGRKMDDNNPLKKFILLPEHTPITAKRKGIKFVVMIPQYNAGAATVGHVYFDDMIGVLDKLAKNAKTASKKLDYEKTYQAFKSATNSERVQIGRIINKANEIEFPNATIVRADLNKLAEAHHISGKSINLKNDTGFPFIQDYKIMETQQLKLGTGSNKISLNVKVPTEKIDFAKQDIGFTPNFIHGFGDATHKSLTAEILRKKGVKNFIGIHDSFGVHAGNSQILNEATKQAFKNIYQGKNIIKIMYKEFEKQGIKMQSFRRNSRGQKISIKLTVKEKRLIPENMREQYSLTLLGDWKYIGTYFEENGKKYATQAIKIDDIGKQGNYNFKELDNSLYFFH